jgi:hypothetical protein
LGNPVKLTLFSVEQANRLLAEIRPELERLVQLERELDRLQRRVDVQSLAVSGATAENPDAQVLRHLVERREGLVEEIGRGVAAIQERGPVIKDLSSGLIDFYSIAGDRLIFLCWRMGEKDVSHWHTLEGGFANRQPLDRSARD